MALRKALKEGHIHSWRRSTGGKFAECHASTAFRGALREVLENPAVMTLIADTKAAAEVRALMMFFETLADRPDRRAVRPGARSGARHARHRRLAHHGRLSFAREMVNARRRWARTVDEVRGAGVRCTCSRRLHASGEQLGELTGVAATLRFPLPDSVTRSCRRRSFKDISDGFRTRI